MDRFNLTEQSKVQDLYSLDEQYFKYDAVNLQEHGLKRTATQNNMVMYEDATSNWMDDIENNPYVKQAGAAIGSGFDTAGKYASQWFGSGNQTKDVNQANQSLAQYQSQNAKTRPDSLMSDPNSMSNIMDAVKDLNLNPSQQKQVMLASQHGGMWEAMKVANQMADQNKVGLAGKAGAAWDVGKAGLNYAKDSIVGGDKPIPKTGLMSIIPGMGTSHTAQPDAATSAVDTASWAMHNPASALQSGLKWASNNPWKATAGIAGGAAALYGGYKLASNMWNQHKWASEGCYNVTDPAERMKCNIYHKQVAINDIKKVMRVCTTEECRRGLESQLSSLMNPSGGGGYGGGAYA